MKEDRNTIHDFLAVLVAHPFEFTLTENAIRWVLQHPQPAIQEICGVIEKVAQDGQVIEKTYALVEQIKPKHPVMRIFRAKDTFFRKDDLVLKIKPSKRFIEYFTGAQEQVAAAPRRFKFFKLTQEASDDAIIADIGGIETIAVTLDEIYCLLKNQPEQESRELTKEKNRQNIFYVQIEIARVKTTIAVSIIWTADGWQVSADALKGGLFHAVWQLTRPKETIICVPL